MEYIITNDNVKIYYKDKGKGQSLIFIHGWAADHRCYEIPMRVLSKSYRTISYDLRGHGKSKCKYNLTIERCGEDLGEIIEKLNVREPILVGWSMGALVSFEYIKQYGCSNLKGMVIIDMGPKLINDRSWRLGLFNGSYIKENNELILYYIKNDWRFASNEFIKQIDPNINKIKKLILSKVISNNDNENMFQMWKSMGEVDYRDILNKITVPTLIIYGGSNNIFSLKTFEYMNKNIPDSKIIKFDDSTHMLVLEKPDNFIQVIKEFAFDIEINR